MHFEKVSTAKRGDLVRERDSRHVGMIERIKGNTVRVRWIENGWISEVLVSDLIKLRKGKNK